MTMLRQWQCAIEIPTEGRGLYEITSLIAGRMREAGMRSGLAVLQILHTSASLLIQENADPEVRADLERFFARLVPDGDRLFRHTSEGEDDMPAHVRAALTTVNLTVPFREGRLVLGTWQGIYVWEHRRHRHHRTVFLHMIGN